MIEAVVFDLDDTLFPETDYVRSGFSCVGRVLEQEFGIADGYAKLMKLFEENRTGVFDRFVSAHGLEKAASARFTELYRAHRPDLVLPAESKTTLVSLREKGYRLGVITDGRPEGQRNKIAALGLKTLVDRIIVTDELGGPKCRKPSLIAFEQMCGEFGIVPRQMMYVGDNPQKDFAAAEIGVVTVRLQRGGLYGSADYYNGIQPSFIVKELSEIEGLLQ